MHHIHETAICLFYSDWEGDFIEEKEKHLSDLYLVNNERFEMVREK
ncbi:MAG: hypothetical protein ACJASQ_002470 [Crocinitomicaceae bacterium]|jgi:hypothetical protein